MDTLPTCTYAYNRFASTALNCSNPFQLTFGRPPNVLLEIETNTQEGTTGSCKEYCELIRKLFAYLQKIVEEYGLKQLDMPNKEKPMTLYNPKNLVYLISPSTVLLKISR